MLALIRMQAALPPLLTVAPALLVLIPLATGILWLVFFSRKDLKDYFQADQKTV